MAKLFSNCHYYSEGIARENNSDGWLNVLRTDKAIAGVDFFVGC
jgi:hypothetical protein